LAIIDTYAAAKGQLINDAKLSISFSPQCNEEIKSGIEGILNTPNDEFEERFLGLPTLEGRMNKRKFDDLQAKLSKRLMR
jgi:hypothetical protein